MNEVKKEIDIMDKDGGDLLPEVYDAYFVDEVEPAPPKPLAYKLGRVAGSVIVLAGFVNRVIQAFRPGRRENGLRPGNGGGRGMGRGRGKGRRQRHRRKRK